MKNLLICLMMLVLTVSLSAKNFDKSNSFTSESKSSSKSLDKPWHLVASRDSLSSTVNLSWSMPDTVADVASFEDNFNSMDFNDHTFKPGWTVVQGEGFAYDHLDEDPDVGYWFRTYYHLNPYHPWWGGNGNGHARVNWGNNINTSMITPKIAVDANTKIIFDWASGYDYNVPEDHGNFMIDISLDDGLNWETIWHWDNIAAWNMWMPVLETTINLSSYAGYAVKVAFHFQQNDGAYLIMDNVKIAASNNPAGTVVIWDPDKNNNSGIAHAGYQSMTFQEKNNFSNSASNKTGKDGLTGFKVFRNNVQIHEITNPSIKSYTDLAVPNGTHSYKVVAVYGAQQSEPSSAVQIVINTTDIWMYYGSTTEYKQHFSRNMHESWKAAVDFDIPANLSGCIAKKMVTATYTALQVPWKIVPFNNSPGETPIGNLFGTINTIEHSWNNIFVTYYDATATINDSTPLSGHIAVVLEMPSIEPSETQQNAVNCQEMDFWGNPNGLNSWYQATPSEPWMNLDYLNLGAWNIRLMVYKDGVGITEEILPGKTQLAQNYPNPFNPTTTISFYNTIGGKVDLTVYNAKGEVVNNLIHNNNMQAGNQNVNFNAAGLNSGVYYYTLTTPAKTITKKMILIK